MTKSFLALAALGAASLTLLPTPARPVDEVRVIEHEIAPGAERRNDDREERAEEPEHTGRRSSVAG